MKQVKELSKMVQNLKMEIKSIKIRKRSGATGT